MSFPLIITIDGPAGVGKSSVAAKLSCYFNVPLLNSGLLYRSITYFLTTEKSLSIDGAVQRLSHPLFSYVLSKDFLSASILWDGVDITSSLRTSEISQQTSCYAVHQKVRDAVDTKSRAILQKGGIAEGRDMGLTFPHAALKIFLTASAEARARRRKNEFSSSESHTEILKELEIRDARDSNRNISPLQPVSDALMIDSTNLSLDEVLTTIIAAVPPLLRCAGVIIK